MSETPSLPEAKLEQKPAANPLAIVMRRKFGRGAMAVVSPTTPPPPSTPAPQPPPAAE